MIDKKRISEFRAKYNVTQADFSFLYFILAKADIDIDLLNDVDWNWLRDNDIQEIQKLLEQKKKEKENKIKYLANSLNMLLTEYSTLFVQFSPEMSSLKHKLKSGQDIEKLLKNKLFSILQKIDSLENITILEIDYLQSNNLNEKKFNKLLDFLKLKIKYDIANYSSNLPSDRLYKILCKLDNDVPLTNKDIQFLDNKHFTSLLKVHELQQKKCEEEFFKLKEKYQATLHSKTFFNNPLYKILQNLEAGNILKSHEVNWLKVNNLNDTVTIADFMALKFKYEATENQDISLSSHLYKVLKRIDAGIPLQESDANFLKKRKLTKTINIAVEKYVTHLINQIALGQQLNELQQQWIEKNERNDAIALGKTKHFKNLKRKYDVDNISDNSLESPLYSILKKLEQGQRLDATDIAYCQDKNVFYPTTKIYIRYHRFEAKFYEAEYKKTNNKWNIPNISSHWRKANEPAKALQSTENINFDRVKDNKLKSAILTTRGGAFRDNHQLDKAEKSAKRAIEFQPSSHHPYTLMGAICYDRYQLTEGDRWFSEAIKRGASPESVDSEIKKSIVKMKDLKERNQIIKELLKKDPARYSWARRYFSNNSRKKG